MRVLILAAAVSLAGCMGYGETLVVMHDPKTGQVAQCHLSPCANAPPPRPAIPKTR